MLAGIRARSNEVAPARTRGQIWGVRFAAFLIMFAIFWQSYNGRQDVVSSQRAQCLGFGRAVTVPLANAFRAGVDGNRSVAKDPGQSARTQAARTIEADKQLAALQSFDRRLDPRIVGQLNPEGRSIVRWLVQHHQAFSCAKAYPAASPFQFFH